MIRSVPPEAWPQVAADCDAAADLMPTDEHWTRESYERGWPKVRYCLVGAVVAARRRRNPMAPAYAERALILQLGPACDASLECWNDDPDRTRVEVVALLRATAAEARTHFVVEEELSRFADVVDALRGMLGAVADIARNVVAERARARSRACLHRMWVSALTEPWPPPPPDTDVTQLEELRWWLCDQELVDA